MDRQKKKKININNVSLSEDDTSVMFWNHHYWFFLLKNKHLAKKVSVATEKYWIKNSI